MSTASAAVAVVCSDLPAISLTCPPPPPNEVLRDNVVGTLKALLDGHSYAVALEGPEGAGKTTLLSQFARTYPQCTISLFVSAANRLSHDPETIKDDIAAQVYSAVWGDGQEQRHDPSFLKRYYTDLQRAAKRANRPFYFIVDGLEELIALDRERVLQHLADLLPLGIHSFRFLFSGDESFYKRLLGSSLSLKSFPVSQFSAEEILSLMDPHVLSPGNARELGQICRGLPGRLASARRAFERGVTPSDFLADAPKKYPEMFEIDWQQIDTNDSELIRLLALLAHDHKFRTTKELSTILRVPEAETRKRVAAVGALVLDEASDMVRYASSGLRTYFAEQLKDRRSHSLNLIIKRLLDARPDEGAFLDLPEYMEETDRYTDLLEILTPDHIIKVLERSQTLARVDDAVRRGFRGALKLERDADLLRFGIQKSIVAELASSHSWESEVEALVALRRDYEALSLANETVLKEDRLQMLVALVYAVWVRDGRTQAELLEQIRLLVERLSFEGLGARVGAIGAKLTCIDPDLATTLLRKARWSEKEHELDRAFAHLTISALRDIGDERRRDEAIDRAAKSRDDPRAKELLQGIRFLSGKLSPAEVCEKAREIEDASARLLLLRCWITLNASAKNASLVASEALALAVKTTSFTLDASFLADMSVALVGARDEAQKRKLVGELDGVQATALRMGPSVAYVRLQLRIASVEMTYSPERGEARLIDLQNYITKISDMPSKGQAYAHFLGMLCHLRDSKIALPSAVDQQIAYCDSELANVVLNLSESTADHYASLGGIVEGLAAGSIDKALEYTRVVNIESRRDSVLLDVIDVLIRRPLQHIELDSLKKVLACVASEEERDEALLSIIERFADEPDKVTPGQMDALEDVIKRLDTVSDSTMACRGLVCAIKILRRSTTTRHQNIIETILTALHRRWEAIDVGWLKVDCGFAIARDLSQTDASEAALFLAGADRMKAEWRVAGVRSASAYVLCIRLAIRALCGLLPRRLDTQSDFDSIVSLINVIPSYGERAVLWADLSMRAALLGRVDLTEKFVQEYVVPCLERISKEDAWYREGYSGFVVDAKGLA